MTEIIKFPGAYKPTPLAEANPAAKAPEHTGAVSDRFVSTVALGIAEGEAAECVRCGLCKGRTEPVFGAGAPDARVMFVGLAPGPAEDALGTPFADQAGALLGKMMRAMGTSRREVYLTYLIKCHTPNADALGADVFAAWEACKPFFDRQIDAVRPDVVVAMGGAVGALLFEGDDRSAWGRGRWWKYRGFDVMPTFHPVSIIHNPNDRNLRAWMWDDLKKAAKHVGLSVATEVQP